MSRAVMKKYEEAIEELEMEHLFPYNAKAHNLRREIIDIHNIEDLSDNEFDYLMVRNIVFPADFETMCTCGNTVGMTLAIGTPPEEIVIPDDDEEDNADG